MAPAFGIDLFLYSRKCINFEKGTVNGKFFKNGSVIMQNVSIPKLTDNHIAPNNSSNIELYRRLTPFTYCPRNRLGINKFQQAKKMLQNPDPRFMSFLIPQVAANDASQLMHSFFELNTSEIILKSATGMEGRGIVKITRKPGRKYIVRENGNIIELNEDDFKQHFSSGHIPKHGFAQTCVNSYSQSMNNAPFDVRIKVQRRNADEYTITMYPRININKNAVTSNIHQGGVTIPLDIFLNNEYGSEANGIRNSLNNFANDFPAYFQQFLDKPFFDLGIDIGIDRKPDKSKSCGFSLQPMIFEVNAFPGSSGYLGERTGVDNIIATFEYYHYLWNRYINENHSDYIGLTESDRKVS